MLIIHPGFEKTGTTTLQEAVFASHPDIFNLGRPFDPFSKKFGELLYAPDLEYDDLAFSKMAEHVKTSKKIPVLSDEHLPKNAFMRGTIATRLISHFPEARVMFTIRNQLHAIESYYGNHGRILKNVPAPFSGKFVTLENWLEYSWNNWPTSFLGLCDYNSTITLYRRIFGNDRVNVLLFEQLRDDVEKFGEAIAELLRLDAPSIVKMLSGKIRNPRDSARSVMYSHWRQQLFPGVSIARLIPFGLQLRRVFHQNLERSGRFHVPISYPWTDRLNIAYARGNKEIARDFGLPLAQYGYPLNTMTDK